MDPISRVTGLPLYWVQPKGVERHFELRAGEDLLVASLDFRSGFGTLATGESATGTWTFKRVGFLSPRVTVRQAGSETDLAVFYPKWTGAGMLEMADGRAFEWRPLGFWRSQFAFADADGNPWVTFKPGAPESKWSDIFKTQALVEIAPEAADRPELALLALLGWYLIILHNEETAVIAATTTMTVLHPS